MKWLLLFWLAIPWVLQAQTATHITSNAEVGCKVYEGEKEEDSSNSVSGEFIDDSECLRVSGGSYVTYTANGQNISQIQWSASGGTVQSVSGVGGTQAQIQWASNPGNRSVQALITYSNGTIETQNICVERINSPIADFSMMNLDYSVCKGTPIQFVNTSSQNGGTDIVSYFWDFGDQNNTTSTAFSPSFAYTQAGNYSINLTVTNKCGCSNTTTRDIEVLQSTPVQINCASVVCENSVEKYSVQDGCSDGEWDIVGGTMVSNNGNEIEVKWDSVDPQDGFGYVMYRSSCGCREWTTIKIPVILSQGAIKGQEVVCTNNQYKYSLPQWPTTNFQWNLSGPSGNLNFNQQRNEVLFTGYQPGTYELWCTYTNTLLGCEGRASMTIVVEEPLLVTGGLDEVCEGTGQTFYTVSNDPVVWNVSLAGNVIFTSSPTNSPFTYNFLNAGSYTVNATRQNGGCESKGRQIKVLALPDAPTGSILGELNVCSGRPYVYTLSTFGTGVVPVWEVTNGTIQGSNSGNSVTVIFDAGVTTYSVSVRNKLLSTAGCVSTAITKDVSAIDFNSIIINPNSGPFCPSSTQSFSVNLNGITPDSMEWSFEDANFGSFVSGQGTPNITVNFNEISNTPITHLILKIVKCGQIIEKRIEVSLLTLPIISFANNNPICLGSNLQFIVNQGGITSAIQVVFTFDNATTHTENFVSSGIYSFANNSYIQNNSGSNVSQTVTVTYLGTNGCNYNPTVSQVFTIYPETIITISPVYNIVVCDISTMIPHVLMANSSTGLTNTTQWQWYYNGAIIPGAQTNSYTLTSSSLFGDYTVRAKDQNDCWVESAPVNFTKKCDDVGCTADPQISFVPKWESCNTITVSNVYYVGAPDQIEWVSTSVLNLISGQGTFSPVFESNLAGTHVVILRLRYGNRWYSAGYEVQKKYEPKFNIGTVCNGNAYNITLHNTSTIFNITSPITYTFSGAGLSTQTGQTATYANLAPGTYTFTMTMSAPGFPVCSTTQTITLNPVPSVAFAYPNSACLGEVVTLQVPGVYSPENIYTWIFDGTSYVTSQSTANITYNNSGPKTIQLEVRTPNGCKYESGAQGIFINFNNARGNISTPSSVACVGSSIAISYTNSNGVSPIEYIWMNGATAVTGQVSSSAYMATESGNYWPVLVSAEGCKSYVMSEFAVPITFQSTPYVNILAQSNLCAGQSAVLTGIVTDNTLEYQWKKNGMLVTNWANTPYPITLNTGSLTAGTYTYTLEVRPPGVTNGCVGSKDFTLTVSNPPAIPTVSYALQNCQPYEVVITASGPSSGQYNWSNGMTGQSIVVNEGGAYKVTYTAPSGCKVSNQVNVPLSIESLLWVFPTGCYDECREKRSNCGK